MVVSFDAYEFLRIIGLIGCIVLLLFTFFIYFRDSETWSKVLWLCLISILLLINLFLIAMEGQLGKPYGFSIFFAILLFIAALLMAFYLGRNSRH